MCSKLQLFEIFADGAFHPAARIAQRLGVTEAAVHRACNNLVTLGFGVHETPGQGYRLTQSPDLLNLDAIRSRLSTSALTLLSGLEVLEDVDSTNLYLLRKKGTGAASGYACLAEQQHAGRGRLGRAWVSPFGCNIYISLAWRFSAPAPPGLSLAVGVAVTRALRRAGVMEIGLKWPNDVVWRGRKLAGVLVDMVSDAAGSCYAVLGVGVNVSMPASAAPHIDQPWVDLNAIVRAPLQRNMLAAQLLQELLLTAHTVQAHGTSSFVAEWAQLDVLAGQAVTLREPGGHSTGVAHGIDADGALKISVDGVVRRYRYGEVSVRAAAAAPYALADDTR